MIALACPAPRVPCMGRSDEDGKLPEDTKPDDVASVETASPERKLEWLKEAARRANWDAKHGPRHLRTGRFK